MANIPEVLFVCVHNAGRSQMAAGLLAHHATGTVRVASAGSAPADETNPAVRHRRIRLLVAVTITYNIIEAIVALSAGTIADSVALIGFGLDSLIEVASATAVAWQFAAKNPEQRERTALRVIAWSFFALAAYVSVEAVRTLLGGHEPDRSIVGIVLVAISVVVMPFLSWAQRRTGHELGSASAVADSKQTLLCTYLSAGVLVGLVLNAALGWWWADPLVALGLAVVAVREGREALHGRTCCAPAPLADAGADGSTGDADACGCAAGCTASCCAGGAA